MDLKYLKIGGSSGHAGIADMLLSLQTPLKILSAKPEFSVTRLVFIEDKIK